MEPSDRCGAEAAIFAQASVPFGIPANGPSSDAGFRPEFFASDASGRDCHLEHTVALIGEEIIGLLDLIESEAMRDKWPGIEPS